MKDPVLRGAFLGLIIGLGGATLEIQGYKVGGLLVVLAGLVVAIVAACFNFWGRGGKDE